MDFDCFVAASLHINNESKIFIWYANVGCHWSQHTPVLTSFSDRSLSGGVIFMVTHTLIGNFHCLPGTPADDVEIHSAAVIKKKSEARMIRNLKKKKADYSHHMCVWESTQRERSRSCTPQGVSLMVKILQSHKLKKKEVRVATWGCYIMKEICLLSEIRND